MNPEILARAVKAAESALLGRTMAVTAARQREDVRDAVTAALAAVVPSINLPEDEDGAPYPEGVQAIARERSRQITELGYTPEHDEHHTVHDLIGAAVSVVGAKPVGVPAFTIRRAGPDSGRYQRDDLVRAGALIAAAIDLLDRIEAGGDL